MGKKKSDKKGKGKEKTALKTERKAEKKAKKELAKKGEVVMLQKDFKNNSIYQIHGLI
jgi:hypothetical protein